MREKKNKFDSNERIKTTWDWEHWRIWHGVIPAKP